MTAGKRFSATEKRFSAAKRRKNAAHGSSRGSKRETMQPQRCRRSVRTRTQKRCGHPRVLGLMPALLIIGMITALTALARAANAPDDVLLRALKEEMERSKAHRS